MATVEKEEGGEDKPASRKTVDSGEPHNLKVLYCNANGILNKVSELEIAANLYSVDIICVTETHLNKSILDAEIAIPDFQPPFRCDRNFSIINPEDKSISGGGGSVIYVRDDLICSKVDGFSAPDSVAVEVKTNVGLVNIACVYRSGSLTLKQSKLIMKSLSNLANINEETIVYGDFNLPNVDWLVGSVSGSIDTVDKSLVFQNVVIWLFMVSD